MQWIYFYTINRVLTTSRGLILWGACFTRLKSNYATIASRNNWAAGYCVGFSTSDDSISSPGRRIWVWKIHNEVRGIASTHEGFNTQWCGWKLYLVILKNIFNRWDVLNDSNSDEYKKEPFPYFINLLKQLQSQTMFLFNRWLYPSHEKKLP